MSLVDSIFFTSQQPAFQKKMHLIEDPFPLWASANQHVAFTACSDQLCRWTNPKKIHSRNDRKRRTSMWCCPGSPNLFCIHLCFPQKKLSSSNTTKKSSEESYSFFSLPNKQTWIFKLDTTHQQKKHIMFPWSRTSSTPSSPTYVSDFDLTSPNLQTSKNSGLRLVLRHQTTTLRSKDAEMLSHCRVTHTSTQVQ